MKESFKSERKLNRKVNKLEAKLSKLSKKYKALTEAHEDLLKAEKKKAPKSKKSPKVSKDPKEKDPKKGGSSKKPSSPVSPKPKSEAFPWGSGDSASKENLKRIKGVGPATEKKLNAIGIFQYAQIGNLSATDVPTLAKALEINVSMIERNEWIKQAKSLSGN
ncbi:MAG: hypothetical protein R8P61_05150 [Bacteroidia bacterium]|nr:hypothetical protein [Bacteroidia bacterium]